jgi:hypothetical protein
MAGAALATQAKHLAGDDTRRDLHAQYAAIGQGELFGRARDRMHEGDGEAIEFFSFVLLGS